MFQQEYGICPIKGTSIDDVYDPNAVITVDPSYQDCDGPDYDASGDYDYDPYLPRQFPLVPCKNNCRGVAGVTIVAGGAALVAATSLAATSFSPVLSLIIGELNINIYTG